MPELERALQMLMDAPSTPPPSLSELEGRVSRRRRRHRTLAGGALAVTLLIAGASVPALLDGDQEASTVRTGPASEAPIGGRPHTPSRVSVDLPPGWQTLDADGDRLAVGTHPLQERDLLLALLARDDAAFRAFPPDGVVVVVGGDPTKAKYVGSPSGETRTTVVRGGETHEVVRVDVDGVVGPGPALALGPAKALPGEVTVRLGDVPQSPVWIAAYAGRASAAVAMAEAETIAATVRLTPQNRAETQPPPPGSRPGLPQGEVPVPAERLQPVASVTVAGATYTLRAEKDCAVVTATGLGPPLAGGCSAQPPGGGPPAVVAVTTDSLPPIGQGRGAALSPETMVVLLRVSSGVNRVTAELVDGRVVDGTVGSDGWALVATDGRAFLVEARDEQGQVVARTPVT